MKAVAATVHVHHVVGRGPGTGPVLAVFTDGPSDLAVAAHAARLAGVSRTLIVAAAAVTRVEPGRNPLVNRTVDRVTVAESAAIVGRVTPVLATAGVAYVRTVLPVRTGVDPALMLPAAEVVRLVDRFGAAVVVTAAPLHDPTGRLRFTGRHGPPRRPVRSGG